MKVYKLIKTYPFSQNLGYIFNENNYPKSQHNKDMIYSINKYPEFWEEIEEKMTLKDKFLELAFAKISSEELRDESVKITDDFAINFANWYEFTLRESDNLNERFTPKQLIEMFKKEKGL